MLTSKLIKGALAAVLLVGAPGAGVALAQGADSLEQPMQEQPTPGEVSDSQLDSFVNAYKTIQGIQQEIQPEMVAAVEASGLTVEEFMTIAQTQQSPEAETAEIPADQAEQFAAAAEEVVAIQEAARSEMTMAIEEEGLSVEEFEAIMAMAQEDPELTEEINQRLSQ